jgi:hypothetical protein
MFYKFLEWMFDDSDSRFFVIKDVGHSVVEFQVLFEFF